MWYSAAVSECEHASAAGPSQRDEIMNGQTLDRITRPRKFHHGNSTTEIPLNFNEKEHGYFRTTIRKSVANLDFTELLGSKNTVTG